MAADLDRITAERIRDEFVKLLLRRRPGRRAAAARRHRARRARSCPELSGLKLEIDEHAQHKDVYEHTLTVVAQRRSARGRRRPRPRAAAGRADARHRQAGDEGGRPRRPGQLPPPRGRRRAADQAADEGDEVTRRTSSPTWSGSSSCTCASTGTAAASGPTPRCAATSPTPGPAAPPAQADPLGLHHPQPAQGRRSSPPTTTRSRSGSRASPERRTSRGSAPTWTATRSWSCSASRPGPIVGRAWRHLKELRLDRGPLDRDEAEAELLRWARENGHI